MATNFFKINNGISLSPQGSAPSGAKKGDLYFDDSLNTLKIYNGTSWQGVGGGGGATLTIDTGLTGGSFDGTSNVTIGIDNTVLATLSDTQTLTNKSIDDALSFKQIATPSASDSGYNKFYIKADGNFYTIDNLGTETLVGEDVFVLKSGDTMTGTLVVDNSVQTTSITGNQILSSYNDFNIKLDNNPISEPKYELLFDTINNRAQVFSPEFRITNDDLTNQSEFKFTSTGHFYGAYVITPNPDSPTASFTFLGKGLDIATGGLGTNPDVYQQINLTANGTSFTSATNGKINLTSNKQINLNVTQGDLGNPDFGNINLTAQNKINLDSTSVFVNSPLEVNGMITSGSVFPTNTPFATYTASSLATSDIAIINVTNDILGNPYDVNGSSLQLGVIQFYSASGATIESYEPFLQSGVTVVEPQGLTLSGEDITINAKTNLGEPPSTAGSVFINTLMDTVTSGYDTGSINLTTGNTDDGDSGNIVLQTGTTVTGTRGSIQLNASSVSVSSKITNVTDPTAPQDAATKTYCDYRAAIGSLAFNWEQRPSPGSNYMMVISKPITITAASTKYAACVVAASGSNAVFTLYKNSSSIGSVTFATGSNTGTFTFASDVSFVAGDLFKIVAPSPQNGTLEQVALSIPYTI